MWTSNFANKLPTYGAGGLSHSCAVSSSSNSNIDRQYHGAACRRNKKFVSCEGETINGGSSSSFTPSPQVEKRKYTSHFHISKLDLVHGHHTIFNHCPNYINIFDRTLLLGSLNRFSGAVFDHKEEKASVRDPTRPSEHGSASCGQPTKTTSNITRSVSSSTPKYFNDFTNRLVKKRKKLVRNDEPQLVNRATVRNEKKKEKKESSIATKKLSVGERIVPDEKDLWPDAKIENLDTKVIITYPKQDGWKPWVAIILCIFGHIVTCLAPFGFLMWLLSWGARMTQLNLFSLSIGLHPGLLEVLRADSREWEKNFYKWIREFFFEPLVTLQYFMLASLTFPWPENFVLPERIRKEWTRALMGWYDVEFVILKENDELMQRYQAELHTEFGDGAKVAVQSHVGVVHPHGLMPSGMVVFGSHFLHFHTPDQERLTLCAAPFVARFAPLQHLQQNLLGGKILNAATIRDQLWSKKAASAVLLERKKSGPKRLDPVALLVLGGTAEIFTPPNSIYIKRRRGLFNYALRYGLTLVPIYTIGEHDTFAVHPVSWLPESVKQFFSDYNLPAVFWWSDYYGILPNRCKLKIVVGGPGLHYPRMQYADQKKLSKEEYKDKVSKAWTVYTNCLCDMVEREGGGKLKLV